MKRFLKILAWAATLFLGLELVLLLSFSRPVNPNARDPAFVKGVYHIHSLFSDGLGDKTEIAAAAADLGLDFVILTDHGRPNPDSAAATSRIKGALVIGGSELTVRGGHLAAAGFAMPEYKFSPESQQAIDEISAQETGITFLAHPFDGRIPWTEPQVRGMTGIEIISYYQQVKKMFPPRLLSFFLLYPLNPDYALTSHISFPRRELAFWDELNREGRYLGIHALDAHAKLPLGPWSLKFPSYRAMFRILNLYVRCPAPLPVEAEQAAGLVLKAIKRGDFFNVVESLAAADGFDCRFEPYAGPAVFMGGEAPSANGEFVFNLPFPFATKVLLYRNGRLCAEVKSKGNEVARIPVSLPGVYRAEIYLSRLRFRNIPWIISNPFFLGVPSAEKTPRPSLEKNEELRPLNDPHFQAEKNRLSTTDLNMDTGKFSLSFVLNPDPEKTADFWVAAAERGRRDWSDFSAINFSGKASRPMRLWLQFRAGEPEREECFERSFLLTTDWTAFEFPFSSFYQQSQNGKPPELGLINSFFFLLDGRLAYPDSTGEFSIKDIGLRTRY